ncbi:MAG: serine acetyltransferase [Deltaproteobacteria bacterium]|nr:serine acetyltransferase [Deltaproteobacteria bacterium]
MSTAAPVKPPLLADGRLDELVSRLLSSYDAGPRSMHHLGAYELPQMSEVERALNEIRALLFPGFVGNALDGASEDEVRAHVRERMGDLARRLGRQVYRGLHHRCQLIKGRRDHDCSQCAELADGVTTRFLEALPDIRATLASDVDAAYEGDPAAKGTDEVIFCYPGLYAISSYRVANRLLCEGSSIIPRMITELAHEKTGIDIHPGAAIGPSFFIDHGTGIVIGETTVIGDRVRIYQGVTLGALSLPKGKARECVSRKRHPTIEDDVIIYANATILGGDTVIGRGAVIGGNCWVTHSIPPAARVSIDGTTVGPG